MFGCAPVSHHDKKWRMRITLLASYCLIQELNLIETGKLLVSLVTPTSTRCDLSSGVAHCKAFSITLLAYLWPWLAARAADAQDHGCIQAPLCCKSRAGERQNVFADNTHHLLPVTRSTAVLHNMLHNLSQSNTPGMFRSWRSLQAMTSKRPRSVVAVLIRCQLHT